VRITKRGFLHILTTILHSVKNVKISTIIAKILPNKHINPIYSI